MTSPPGRRAMTVGVYFLAAFAPFALLILVMLLLGGPEQEDRGSLIRVDLLFFTYSAGAFIAGGVVGLFLPAMRRLWSALLVGLLAMLPWMVGISVTFDHGYSHWTNAHTFTTAVLALVLGAALCYGFFAASAPSSPSKRATRRHRGGAG